MDLSPVDAVARAGDRFVLECSARGCEGVVSFTWKTLKDFPLYGRVENNGLVSRQILERVQSDFKSLRIACVATCDGEKRQRETKLSVYSLEQPVISRAGAMVVGQESVFTCTVPVFPVEILTVQWLLDDRVVKTEEFPTLQARGVKEVTSQYAHTSTHEDQGRTLTCRATLDLVNLAEDLRSRETNVTMAMQPTQPELEPTLDPKATTESTLEPAATPEPILEPAATPEPILEPAATPEPTLEPAATPEPILEPAATPEPTLELEATPEPTLDPEPSPVVSTAVLTVLGSASLLTMAAILTKIYRSSKKTYNLSEPV